MEILLIRHGESEADILNVHEGRADFPLTAKGRNQVHLMAARVKNEFPPEIIWASTLQRVSETASVLAEKVGCPIHFEEELMEYNNGILAGLSFKEAKKYPNPKYLHERIEGGESHIEFRMRIESIFSKILSSAQYNRIAIVAHGGVINCLLRSFFHMPVTKDFYFKNGDTGISYIEITEQDKVVHFLNSIAHLSK
ncbi:histidine phosphatase family protein [Sporosarcina limicola]|uniref:2,3-bisphosphoglycerate-dependent phosphoglycerate mutase n=1 Tax=Sporosarcina limicola TaxID=34101 RepID=A0A927R3V9_9BACL|nr:histidine phosphatase family protein [Sporosarcina limicola]MBE1554178.1 2,3-bisphosphoglycerate-dependent phosphoglycerate mutase [Sporosarcina limicola]